MPSKPAGRDQQWLIVAIPGGVVFVLAASFILIYLVRSKPKSSDESAPTAIAKSSAQPNPAQATPPAPPAVASTAPPAPAAPTPGNALVSSTPATPTAPPAAPAEVDTNPPAAPAPAAPAAPKNLLALVNLPGDAVAGGWTLENGQLKNPTAKANDHSRIRLIPPPADTEYDFSMTFITGPKPYVAQILTFKGKQFIWSYFQRDSGFANVGGKGAHANPSNVPRGIKANTKYTSVIKVRNDSVSAYLNGELYSTLKTDYSDLSLNPMWDLGAAKPLGIVAQCPITIDAITLTPISAGEDSTPENPVAATPAAPTPASAYKQLAHLITNGYSTQSSAAATQPTGNTAAIPADLQAVVATTQPVISDVAGTIAPGHAPAHAPSGADADALFHAVAIATGRDPAVPGRPSDPLMDRPESDESPPLIGAPRLFAGLYPTAPSNLDRAAFDLEQTRLAAWKTLTDQLSQIYAHAKPSTAVVKLELAPNGSFFAINASPTHLSNTTLVIEIVNVATAPSVSTRQYFFLPTWAPGHKIFLPAAAAPNVASPELLAMTAPAISWTVTDAVEAHVQLWSDKVTQPMETTKFDANAERIARAQLTDAYCTLGDYLRRPGGARVPTSGAAPRPNALFIGPIIPPKIALADSAPVIVQVKAIAKRVQAILPAGSPLTADANALAADPQTALRDLRKRQLDEFLAAVPSQKIRNGIWAIHRPGELARLSPTRARNTPNKITLTIDTHGPSGEVTATLANPEQPTLKRRFAGRMQVDGSANRVLLQLRASSNNTHPTEADIKLAATWTRLLLEVHETELRGIAEIGAGDNPITVNVAFGQPQDIPKPTPAK